MEEPSQLWVELAIYLFLAFLSLAFLLFSWVLNRYIQTKRNRYLEEQENYFRGRIGIVNLKTYPEGACQEPVMVTGSVVIANNYFVSWASQFRNFFGGRMNGYTDLCIAARRLAVVRLLQDADRYGANAVYNVRFETATIMEGNNNKQSAGGVELIAYGTAVKQMATMR
ncbi:MAG: heavy metal-binding domain-containing protein [Victivallales bacterium]|nr:heavy metal-binding domain-containing protein [Victivallales bacterium]